MAEYKVFMLPGPTQIPPRVLRANSSPMVNHRGPEFGALMKDVCRRLKSVFKTENDIVMLTSSGTGGLEASVTNFINPGDKVIVASIGSFGERFRDIATRFGADVDFIDFGWGNTVDPKVIAQRLEADTNHEIKAIFFQQNETSTGILNPVKEIAAARGDHPALLIVDAVSGLGAAELDTDGWGLDVVVTGSQKALMAPPGLAFVSISERAWKANATCTNSSFYLDLKKHKEFAEQGQTPYTPAISTAFAVHEALHFINELGGIDVIVKEHAFKRDVIRNAVKAIGLDLVAPDAIASPAVTAIYTPEGIAPTQITKLAREKYDCILAGGFGPLKEKSFRIGHLGYVSDADIIATISILEMCLAELGFQVQLGTGVAVAQRMLIEYRS